MKPDNDPRADELLRLYYQASDAACDAALGKLMLQLQRLARALFIRRGARGDDLDDLCSDATTRLIEALRNSRPPAGKPITDCVGYTLTVAINLYIDRKRGDSPWRALQACIHKIVKERRLFARWRWQDLWFLGLIEWVGQAFRCTPRFMDFRLDTARFRKQALGNNDPTEMPLPELMLKLFHWLDTPAEENELITLLADLREIRRPITVSLEDLTANASFDSALLRAPNDTERAALDIIAMEQLGARLWPEVCALRPLQRAALLLGMEWVEWLDLEWTPTAVAELLGITQTDMDVIYRTLPLTDAAIAARLGLPDATKVSNLRKCARERLQRRSIE